MLVKLPKEFACVETVLQYKQFPTCKVVQFTWEIGRDYLWVC